jgi:hypothetical protein
MTSRSGPPPFVIAARLVIGLVQGVAFYLLSTVAESESWPASKPLIFAPLVIVVCFVPILISVSLGNLRRRRLILWISAGTVVLCGLAIHDISRGYFESGPAAIGALFGLRRGLLTWPSDTLMLFAAIGLFIAQVLVTARQASGRLLGSYAQHFDAAWKYAVEAGLSAVFLGIFWLLLWLGAALFRLIGIEFFGTIIQQRWFSLPATTLALQLAIHVTDTRSGIVRGMRTLILILLSVLLPLGLLFVLGFLASLPYTGLEVLWATRHATALLLTAAAVLVVLVNATYQDAAPEHAPNHALRYVASIACLALAPLVAIAGYALALRVQEHGWTNGRIYAAVCVLVTTWYALAYAWAVLRRGPWLRGIETGNFVGAYLVLAVLLALFTPIADPARLSVASQVARLQSGAIAADKFDYAYLRFEGARYGIEALERLKTSAEGKDAASIRASADAALRMSYPGEQIAVATTPERRAANIAVYPHGGTLPTSFLDQNWAVVGNERGLLPQCLTQFNAQCEAVLLDLNGDGRDEVALLDPANSSAAITFEQGPDGTWRTIGALSGPLTCKTVLAALRDGTFSLVPPPWREVDAGGQRLLFQSDQEPAGDPCSNP